MASLKKIEQDIELAVYKKNGNIFETFAVSSYKLIYPDLLAVKPQGSKGDGANDGYLSGDVLLQVYGPEKVDADKAIAKMRSNFERAKTCNWNFKEWHFIINDKFETLARDIHHAIDTLKKDNPNYKIKIIDSESLKNIIIGQLPTNRVRVHILLNSDKDISNFGDFEKVEKVIDAISEEQDIRNLKITDYMNFSKESFEPNGIKKLVINIDEKESADMFKFFGTHIEKAREVMEEFIPQIGLDLFNSIGKYIQGEYEKFEKSLKPEFALIKTSEVIYKKLDNDANLQTALWVVIAYFFDICDIGKIK